MPRRAFNPLETPKLFFRLFRLCIVFLLTLREIRAILCQKDLTRSRTNRHPALQLAEISVDSESQSTRFQPLKRMGQMGQILS